MILVTGRTIKQGIASQMGKTSEDYKREVAVLFLTRKDMEAFALTPGDNAIVKSAHGSVVVRCEEGKWGKEGMAFMPYGPWANLITGPDTQGTGMPDYKGCEVTIEKTSDPVLTQEGIASLLRRAV